jgi:hypothetical protein
MQVETDVVKLGVMLEMEIAIPTLRDWYAEHQLLTVNGVKKWSLWQLRALSVVFDGRPLGEHLTPAPGSPRRLGEKVWEMDALARTLVSARLDREVRYLTTVAPSDGATPDFVARVRDGRDMAVEHTRICAESDKMLAKSLSRVQAEVSRRIAAAGSTLPPGAVAFAFPSAPFFEYVDATADEMVRAMREVAPTDRFSTLRHPLDAAFPVLQALGVHWTVVDPNSASAARVEPWLIETDPKPVAESIVDVIAKKTEKYAAYRAYGDGAWLTVWVDVEFCLPTTVLRILEGMGVNRGPFERVLVGCSTPVR